MKDLDKAIFDLELLNTLITPFLFTTIMNCGLDSHKRGLVIRNMNAILDPKRRGDFSDMISHVEESLISLSSSSDMFPCLSKDEYQRILVFNYDNYKFQLSHPKDQFFEA